MQISKHGVQEVMHLTGNSTSATELRRPSNKIKNRFAKARPTSHRRQDVCLFPKSGQLFPRHIFSSIGHWLICIQQVNG